MTGYPGHVHRQGSNNIGGHVTTWQQALQRWGYPLTADGAFGPVTNYWTRQFQGVHGLAVDGDVGPLTWGAA